MIHLSQQSAAPHDLAPTASDAAAIIRPLQPSDHAAIVAIENAYRPDAPQRAASEAHDEQTYDPEQPSLQLVAERAGRIVGVGRCGSKRGLVAPDASMIWVAVAPEQCGQGIARRLSDELIAWAGQAGRQRLISGCSARWSRSAHVLRAAGFAPVGQRYELTLDLDQFDETPFVGVFAQIAACGITLTTLAQERRPDAVERLYRLAHPLLRSIPLPAGVILDMQFGAWCALEIDAPDAASDAIVIAKRGDEYIGYSGLRVPAHGPAQTIMTGVRPDLRRQGVALALKLQTIRIARARGYHEMRTNNDTANPGILALNQRLGYTALPAWLVWEKRLSYAS
jgi:GNAT superfamily N-acetyltransferase